MILYSWPIVHATILFLADLWLAMTIRESLELTFDSSGSPHRGGRARTRAPEPPGWGRTLARHLAFFGLLNGLVVVFGALGQVAVGFPVQEWRDFLAAGWRQPSFAASLTALLATHAWEAVRYRRRVLERSDAEGLLDHAALRANWARLVLVVLGTLALPLASALGFGAAMLVTVIALVNLAVDAFPAQVGRRLGFEP